MVRTQTGVKKSEMLLTNNIQKTVFKISDFLQWQRNGDLQLSPSFQRRPVWSSDAKSYLVDTIVRGLPVPIIFLREKLDIERQSAVREVVDGQQRLRTLLSFIDPACLADYQPKRDAFQVRANHNKEIAGKDFASLNKDTKTRILTYEFSTHVLPTTLEDREVLQIFARMNSTGTKASHQELRNARYFGEFKTLCYSIAYEHLSLWRQWSIFTEEQIARMKEVELTSDLLMNMESGITGKSQARIDKHYMRHDAEYEYGPKLAEQFRRVMHAVDGLLSDKISKTVYRSEVHFFTLFAYLYDYMYGFGSKAMRPKRSPSTSTAVSLIKVSKNFETYQVPLEVADAVFRASADTGRRKERHKYMKKICGF
ncbi:MAG: DUF262 domain-containing protein [Planctomycetota bacterium]